MAGYFISQFILAHRTGETAGLEFSNFDFRKLEINITGQVMSRGTSEGEKIVKIKNMAEPLGGVFWKINLNSVPIIAFFSHLIDMSKEQGSDRFIFTAVTDPSRALPYNTRKKNSIKYFGLSTHAIRALAITEVQRAFNANTSGRPEIIQGHELANNTEAVADKHYLDKMVTSSAFNDQHHLLDLVLKFTDYEIPERYLREAKIIHERGMKLKSKYY